ncbi:conserved hypothetical protein [Streptomyces sviceus ATCC 29083]|uniref:Uncharacterized protein n=1 Tax=Streptomyces sviceus (strain ATCC 29083 / DSM 924 / JCM 4929 / NBRC 13980 / NCIMB 11184 / NRRL 5439 / UC 5370) TaxID=463191 RepID=B5HRX0_STRX2|nr:conserved hypothetical protein [Streptomyces sviceus ATCC 29083]
MQCRVRGAGVEADRSSTVTAGQRRADRHGRSASPAYAPFRTQVVCVIRIRDDDTDTGYDNTRLKLKRP